jgi:hypothetical protein
MCSPKHINPHHKKEKKEEVKANPEEAVKATTDKKQQQVRRHRRSGETPSKEVISAIMAEAMEESKAMFGLNPNPSFGTKFPVILSVVDCADYNTPSKRRGGFRFSIESPEPKSASLLLEPIAANSAIAVVNSVNSVSSATLNRRFKFRHSLDAQLFGTTGFCNEVVPNAPRSSLAASRRLKGFRYSPDSKPDNRSSGFLLDPVLTNPKSDISKRTNGFHFQDTRQIDSTGLLMLEHVETPKASSE